MIKRLFVCESLECGDDEDSNLNQKQLPKSHRSAYTDHIFKSPRLNSFLLHSNMTCGKFYRNCINASLMSHRTQAAKQQLEVMKLKTNKSFNNSEQQPKTPSHLPNLKLSLPPKSEWLYTSVMCLEIFLIVRYCLITYYLSDNFTKQTLITTSQPPGTLKYEALEFVRPINLLREAPKLLLQQKHATSDFYQDSNTTNPVGQTYAEQVRCLGELQKYLNDHFGRFYLWKASVGLDWRNASYLLFNGDTSRFRLLLEENYAMQISRKETKVYTYLIACFVITCFLGSLIAGKIPYDITPLLLIYDPQLVAFTIKQRVCRYLEHMRQSYVNFWSSYSLGEANELVFRGVLQRKIGLNNQKLNDDSDDLDEYDDIEDNCGDHNLYDNDLFVHHERSAEKDTLNAFPLHGLRRRRQQAMLQCNIHATPPPPSTIWQSNQPAHKSYKPQVASRACGLLSCKNFDNYLPRIRSQSWRRVLMVLQPLSYQSGLAFTVGSLMGLWYLFLHLNLVATRNNTQFKLFLQNRGTNEGQPFRLSQFQGLPGRCSSLLNESNIDLNHVRKMLVRSYAHSFRNLDQRDYSLKVASYLKSSFDGYDTQESNNWLPSPDAIDLEIIANTLAPLEMPHNHFWIVPTLCAALPCLLVAIYLTILSATLLDLGIWLVELRLKLNICIDVLRHYNQQFASPNLPTPNSSYRASVRSDRILRRSLISRRVYTSTYLASSRPAAALTETNSTRSPRISMAQSSLPADDGEDDLCNVKLVQIFTYLLANYRQKRNISRAYARELINLDQRTHLLGLRKRSRKFLVSTYLDFRLFLDQIEDCRNTINFVMAYCVLHSINIIAASLTLTGILVQVGFVVSAFGLANLSLVGGGFFRSQCMKLYAPINSILALCLRGDKVVLHLASLWRRALIDLCGSRTKLSFRVYSLNISYALALQFNLSIVSLYIILIDRAGWIR